jgi:large subunit ribosomal protein L30
MAKMIKIKLVRSSIGAPAKLKKVVKGLGLRRIDQVVERPDDEAIRGMVAKIPHLVEIVEERG